MTGRAELVEALFLGHHASNANAALEGQGVTVLLADAIAMSQDHPRSASTNETTTPETTDTAEKILCPHCRRTATNGIKCKGICVADSDY
ncbi:hypothetical protein PN441_11805 [Spirulina major CS-329]|uniref:hypothetical protein n=1 Tax=Spirulina sp. TaxID=1157 RepID=UPI003F6EFAE9|nr:hypothetical protein [Spirulina subsalsa CS-330]MDB9503757.1 hypothetical protein [Spirulina major CS-329]